MENESVVCPSFYLMEDSQINDILYVRGGGRTSLAGKALCAKYEYDIVPMCKSAVFFFLLLFVFIIGTACLKLEIARKNICHIKKRGYGLYFGAFYF